jgi:hypothetical protein
MAHDLRDVAGDEDNHDDDGEEGLELGAIFTVSC